MHLVRGSTFYDVSPRYYALYDNDNTKDSAHQYPFMPYPFIESQYGSLGEEVLTNYDAFSVVLYDDTAHEVLNIIVHYLESSIQ